MGLRNMVGEMNAEHPGLEQCLELLRGPQDERRFVGLLLATKLLPAGNQEVLRAISSAVGFRFLTRLLLPLRSLQGPVLNEEEQQNSAAAAGLGLAVTSSLCRVQDLACAEEVLHKVPLIIKVVRSGGISPILQYSAQHTYDSSQPNNADASDNNAVGDALECLLHIVNSSSEGRAIALESGCIQATAQALKAGVAGRQVWQPVAVQLWVSLLHGFQRSEHLAEIPQVIVDAIAALAQMMSVPAPPQNLRSQVPTSNAAESEQRAGLQSLDLAKLQLEAMQALLMMLPLPLPQAESTEAALKANSNGRGEGWATHARSGLYSVLVSRTGAEQRHAALRLTAAVLELAPPTWVMGPAPPLAEAAGSFFQLLTELIKVETGLLMNDAVSLLESKLSADNTEKPAEPGTGRRGSPGALYAAFHDQPQANVPNASSDHETTHDTGNVESNTTSTSAEPCTGTEGQENSQTGDSASQSRGEAAAARRVAEVLPAVLALMEECLSVLADDAADVDNNADSDGSSVAILSDRAAERAMQALSEAAETLLQYLELAAADPSIADTPLALAVIRAYARFMSDVPYAHASRLQAIMPFLVKAQDGKAVPWLLAGLTQCTESTGTELLELQSPEAVQQWCNCLQQPEVLIAFVQLVTVYAQQSQQLWRGQGQHIAADHTDMQDPTASEHRLSLACQMLSNIIQSKSALQSAPAVSQVTLCTIKPAVSSLVAWARSQPDRCIDATAELSTTGLAAVIGLVCGSSLHSDMENSSIQGSAAAVWSAEESADVFNTLLWSLRSGWAITTGQGLPDPAKLEDIITDDELQDWGTVLDIATALVESNIAMKQQATSCSWVQQCLHSNPRQQNPQWALFLQAYLK